MLKMICGTLLGQQEGRTAPLLLSMGTRTGKPKAQDFADPVPAA